MVKVTHLEKELEERLKEFKDTYVDMLTYTISGLDFASEILKEAKSRDVPTISTLRNSFTSLKTLIESLFVGNDSVDAENCNCFWIQWKDCDRERYYRENCEDAKPLTDKILVYELLCFIAEVHNIVLKIEEIKCSSDYRILPLENDLKQIVYNYVFD